MSHLTRETLSRILDEGAEPDVRSHLDACGVCRAELAAMGELKLELARLPHPPVPETVWSGVIRRIVAEGKAASRAPRPVRLRVPLQAAAAVALLGLGFVGGRTTVGPRDAGSVAVAGRPETVEQAIERVENAGNAYREAISDLESFEAVTDPQQRARVVFERLAALDLLADASRSALQVVPEDPVVNNYLYAALQERQRLEASLASAAGDEVFWR